MNKIDLEKQLDKLIKCSCIQTLPYILKETSELLEYKNIIYFSDKNEENEEIRKKLIEEIKLILKKNNFK